MSTKSILKRIICIGSLNFLILSAAMPAQAHYAQIEVGIEQACIKRVVYIGDINMKTENCTEENMIIQITNGLENGNW